jgi:hypothetical protein
MMISPPGAPSEAICKLAHGVLASSGAMEECPRDIWNDPSDVMF